MSRGRNKTRIFDYREPIFAAACLYAASKQANVYLLLSLHLLLL